MASPDVAEGVGCFVEVVGAVDDGRDLPGGEEVGQGEQVLVLPDRREGPQLLRGEPGQHARFGDPALKDKYLDGLTTTDMARLTQGAQFMTEKEGGSDVGRLTTKAVRDGYHWRLHGEKWFCSNADAAIAMVLARPEGAPAGARGLGLFLVPRQLGDGSPNRYRIVRLKEKLGTRSMASGEITFEGAVAYLVGRADRGFAQMAEMVNWSRLSNGVKSTALMRRAWHDALAVARGRVAFGRPVIALPLARRQLVKMLLPIEAALSMCFATADALDRAEAGSQEAALLLRLLTPVLKFRATRDARKVDSTSPTAFGSPRLGPLGHVREDHVEIARRLEHPPPLDPSACHSFLHAAIAQSLGSCRRPNKSPASAGAARQSFCCSGRSR